MVSKLKRNIKKDERSKVTLKKLTFHKLSWLEYITIGLSILFWFYPHPYNVIFSVLLAMPIIGLIVNGLYGRPSISTLVAISKGEKGEDKYDVADFIDFSAWVILIRVLKDFEFESFYSMIIPGTITFLSVLVLLFFTHSKIEQSNKNKAWIYFSLIGNLFIYSYAVTYGANCVYDNSEPKVYSAKVVDKRKHHSRKAGTTYYLKVTPWGHHYDKEEITVTSDQYEETPIGSSVKIDLKEGLFNIPWYYIE
jgi:hypothetical protein